MLSGFSLRDTTSLRTVQAINSQANLLGKQAVVFGGTSGIGHGIAMRLAQSQASVTIVGRNAEQGAQIVKELSSLGPQGEHKFVACDASLMSSIANFSTNFMHSHQRLDYLVLSSGIATMKGRTETIEGIDEKLSTHYFGRMAVVQGLMPLLESTANEEKSDVRVLSILSGGVHAAYADFKKDFEVKESFSLWNAANSAGFYNDLACDALARAHPLITFIHAGPGFVNSNWGTELPWFVKKLGRLIQPLGRSIQDCGEFMSYGLLNPAYKGGMRILNPQGQPASTTNLHSTENADFVWEQVIACCVSSCAAMKQFFYNLQFYRRCEFCRELLATTLLNKCSTLTKCTEFVEQSIQGERAIGDLATSGGEYERGTGEPNSERGEKLDGVED